MSSCFYFVFSFCFKGRKIVEFKNGIIKEIIPAEVEVYEYTEEDENNNNFSFVIEKNEDYEENSFDDSDVFLNDFDKRLNVKYGFNIIYFTNGDVKLTRGDGEVQYFYSAVQTLNISRPESKKNPESEFE
jgi:hypothetical protein